MSKKWIPFQWIVCGEKKNVVYLTGHSGGAIASARASEFVEMELQ